jgi:hypothetical protein
MGNGQADWVRGSSPGNHLLTNEQFDTRPDFQFYFNFEL